MVGIVLVLGRANLHVSLIKRELADKVGATSLLRVYGLQTFSEPRINRACRRHGANIIAYVLPPDCEPSDTLDTSRDEWQKLASDKFPSRSVKELEVQPYANGCGEFWLDGLGQFKSLSQMEYLVDA